ncbi:RNA polymerase sigma factor [Spirosoma endbachense]|jgi:RNA polymerase sigma-70 factor (family 1)|uniref:RNA polymerase sigma-70 factor n=1 Tax=Spirosoma endbachense TaxID=2666025 RepID=A0A6P1W3C6_9BACT|nr:RNA polymerase sigma-70 factor [Spirosoma endbachense]QHV98480.1 RNA polymerase sigma-70 factor [Spirosoma endbachense]
MELTDTELTLRLKQHDEAAFETLFRRYYRYLYSIAIQYVKDPDLAEDALQEVYLKLWTHREQLNESQSVRNYLATAMRHQMINTLRDEKRAILRHLSLQASRPDVDTSTEETLVLSEYGSVVLDGLRQLSAQRRLVFLLRSEKGLTNEEVASQLQISINTVKVQYYHACRFLRDYLRQHAGIEAMIIWLAVFFN